MTCREFNQKIFDEGWYSPIAFPSEWEALRFKNHFNDVIRCYSGMSILDLADIIGVDIPDSELLMPEPFKSIFSDDRKKAAETKGWTSYLKRVDIHPLELFDGWWVIDIRDPVIVFDAPLKKSYHKTMLLDSELLKKSSETHTVKGTPFKDNAERIKRVIFNPPATIVEWVDGTKTIAKVQKGDEFDPYVGFCVALAKEALGSNSAIKKILKEKSNYNDFVNQEIPEKEKSK